MGMSPRVAPFDGTERPAWQFATPPGAAISLSSQVPSWRGHIGAPAQSLLDIRSVRCPPKWRSPKSCSVSSPRPYSIPAETASEFDSRRYAATFRALAMVAGLGLLLVSGAAWSDQQDTVLNFVCLANGTCVYLCASDRDCIKAGCLLPHCDTHTPDGQLCLSDHAAQFCTQATDCPMGNACNGNLCETVCGP